MPEGAQISRVETWLARGGQLKGDDYTRLQDSGIRLVVNLRKNHDEAPQMEERAPMLVSVRIPDPNKQVEQTAFIRRFWDELKEGRRTVPRLR